MSGSNEGSDTGDGEGYESSSGSEAEDMEDELLPNKASKEKVVYFYHRHKDRRESIIDLDPQLRHLQKVNVFTQQLPNFETTVKANALCEFDLIKKNLTCAIAINELRQGLVHWTKRLQTFLQEYGLFFTKDEHLALIHLYLDFMFKTPELDLPLVDMCLTVLCELLKKYEKLERSDLVIEWRPIYDLYLRVNKIDDRSPVLCPEHLEQGALASFIRLARVYFDVRATAEILAELRPMLCPFDMSMNKAMERLKLFLPTVLYEHEFNGGFKLWLNELLDLWTTFGTRHFWETHMLSIFSRVANDTIGSFNWNPYIPQIFSYTLRGFGLPIGLKDAQTLGLGDTATSSASQLWSMAFLYSPKDITTMARWIVSMIGSGPDNTKGKSDLCMQHIAKLFQLLRSFYYPSNTGSWTTPLFTFLEALPENLIRRIRNERKNKNKWYSNPTMRRHQIGHDEVAIFVAALKDVSLMAIFSKSNQTQAVSAYQQLAFLRGDIMLTPLIDQVYMSAESLVEPHRYMSILSCLVAVSRELTTYNSGMDNEQQPQRHVIPLLTAILPGIDPNDSNKFVLTMRFLANVLASVILFDCSPALDLPVQPPLTDYERELCMQTAKFEDFVHEFFTKVFSFIDLLASDISTDASASAAAAATNFLLSSRTKSSDENFAQAHLIQAIKVLVRQSSRAILRLITQKVRNYISGSTAFNARAGRIVSQLCGFLVSSPGGGKEAFHAFFEPCYEKLRELREQTSFYEHFLKNENGDIVVAWQLQLLAELLKAHGTIVLSEMKRASEVLGWFRSCVNKECISHVCNCYRSLISSLSTIYVCDFSSVSYDIGADVESSQEVKKEFFVEHLPLRDWACTGDLFDLCASYHKPTAAELSACISLVGGSLEQSMKFLTQVTTTNTSTSSKEERNRELTYIYHIMYSASRLLKRSATSPPMDMEKLVETQLPIGIDDTLDKGLGFELPLALQRQNEYAELSEAQLNTVLTLRSRVIEFALDYGERHLHSNDTTSLMLVGRILSTASSAYGLYYSDFEKMWKSHHTNKQALQNKLLGRKNSHRAELLQRVMLQYQYRTFLLHTRIIELDVKCVELLFRMSTDSSYAVVRKDAQAQLFLLMSHYPYASMLIVPKLVSMLKRASSIESEADLNMTHDQLKGCLYLLRGGNGGTGSGSSSSSSSSASSSSLMIRQNWSVISEVWPGLLQCRNFEKPSIQSLLDKIFFKANKDYDSFENRIQLPVAILERASQLCDLAELHDADETRLARFRAKKERETQVIDGLLERLIRIASTQGGAGTWKNQATTIGYTLFLLNACTLRADLVRLFVDALVDENIRVRKIAVDGLCIILKMCKFKKQTRVLDAREVIQATTSLVAVDRPAPGERADNQWHMYDEKYLRDLSDAQNETDATKWKQSHFLDKTFLGYYCWPPQIKVNANERPVFDYADSTVAQSKYAEALKPLHERFRFDEAFVARFIRFATIEESKGSERFDTKRFFFFKSLFRNFGSEEAFCQLHKHLEALVRDRDPKTHECSHKLAAEMLSGLVRGSKYWPLAQLKPLWARLRVLLDLVLEHMSNETVMLWYQCFSTMCEDQDPRRMTFYIGYIQELVRRHFSTTMAMDTTTLNGEEAKSISVTSFEQTSCLQLCTAFSQFEWRIPGLWDSLIELFQANMIHPYKAIREKNAFCLSLCIVSELDYTKLGTYPKLNKLIDFVEARLNEYINMLDKMIIEKAAAMDVGDAAAAASSLAKTPEQLEALNFLHSLFCFLSYYMTKSYQPVNAALLRLVPPLCRADKLAAQEESLKRQLGLIRTLSSMWILCEPRCAALFLEQLAKVISQRASWHSRLAGIQMLQNFSIFNAFLVTKTQKSHIRQLVLEALVDEQLEVRLAAALTLTGLIHSEFVCVDAELVAQLKTLSKIQAKSKPVVGPDGKKSVPVINMANLVKRHGGVLGFCAIVNSCPYDVPVYLPEAATYLCQFINDPVPIQGSVRKCLSEFRRTHHDNWREHQEKFSEHQLSILADILISPNYYA